jgi:hypothetical protein
MRIDQREFEEMSRYTSAYQKLFDGVLKRVPAHSPEWTDYNQSERIK